MAGMTTDREAVPTPRPDTGTQPESAAEKEAEALRKTITLDPGLTPEQQYAISQVAANLALEDMRPSEECIREMEAVLLGRKTPEQRIRELNEKYRRS